MGSRGESCRTDAQSGNSGQLVGVEQLKGVWRLEHCHGRVSDLLELDEPNGDDFVARFHDASDSALVLGSSQKLQTVDMARAEAEGVEVLRRRSGGGVVLVVPGRQVWVDFFVPAGGFLWHDDVVRAAWWAGELWASVAALFTAETPTVHMGGLKADRWGRLVCFAGVGPGEVLIAGRKAVGVSQRRNRQRVRIQTAALVSTPSPGRHVGSQKAFAFDEIELLSLTSEQRNAGHAALAKRCGALAADASVVTDALLEAMGERRSLPS